MSVQFVARIAGQGMVCDADSVPPTKSPLFRQDIMPGLRLDVSDPRALITFPAGKGFIIGTLFHRYGPPERVEQLEPAEIEAIGRSRGEHLLRRYWGRYVAVIRSENALSVIRDPSGAMPCYHTSHGREHVLASAPSLFSAAGLPSLSIDTAGVARALLIAGMPETTTALIGVGQLLPGTSLNIEGSHTTTVVRWDPWEFASSLNDQSPEELAADLRRTVQSCVSGWGRLYNKGLLAVSGGLDSSIVAACLRNAENDLSLLTLTTDDPLGDERAFARTMASYLGKPVFEERYSLTHIDLNKSSVSHLPTPGGRVDALSFDATAVKVATDVGANAIFTGNGGDNVFYMSRSARSLADRYSVNGLSTGLLRTLRDICSLTGATATKAISQGVAAWRNAANGYIWREEASFIARDALETLSKTPIDHPWLAIPQGTRLPGKAAHIAMILRMHFSLDAYGEREGVPVLHPLASQPILELCLRIPTWYQCEGGYDRAVARKAFQQSLPASVLERKGKGSPQGFMFEIFEQRRDEIRERLLEGFLATNGIIERASIEEALRPNHQTTGTEIMRLLMFVDTEAWVDHWRSRDEIRAGLPEQE